MYEKKHEITWTHGRNLENHCSTTLCHVHVYELLLGRYLDANAIYSDADAIASFSGIEKGGSTPFRHFRGFPATSRAA